MGTKVIFFAKESKTSHITFFHNIEKLSQRNYNLIFGFYKTGDDIRDYPVNSYFLGYSYPVSDKMSLRKFILLIKNIKSTLNFIKANPGQMIACDLYSFLVVSLSLTMFPREQYKFSYLIENNIMMALNEKKPIIYRKILEFLVRQFICKTKYVIFPSQDLATACKTYLDLGLKKVIVIQYGVEIKKIRKMLGEKVDSADRILFGKKRRIKLLVVSRLEKQKDIQTILKSLAYIKKKNARKIELFIIGDGQLLTELQHLATELKIQEDVHFLGYKNNVFPYLKMSDIFILSSLYEGFGLSLLEAMMVKIPIIATDAPYGPSEILNRGECGMLVPVSDSKKLAEAILNLVDNAGIRKRYIAAAYKRSMQLTAEKMIRKYDKLLQNI